MASTGFTFLREVAANIFAGKITKEAGEHLMPTGSNEEENILQGFLRETFVNMAASVERIKRNTAPVNDQENSRMQFSMMLQADPLMLTLQTQNRPYSMIYIPAAMTLRTNVPGVGYTNYTIAAPGWYILNFPSGAELGVPNGSAAVNVLIRLDSQLFGKNL